MTPTLPVELWRRIFRLTTYTGADLDQVIKHELDSDKFTECKQNYLRTIETKVAISHVSRQFRCIASEFLFEFVSIDKPSQALKLETLMEESSTSDGPRDCIKFLFVRCTDESIMPRVTNVLRLCRDLRGFSWNHPISQTRFQDRRLVEDEMLRSIPTNLRFLNWNSLVYLNVLDAFLHNASDSLEGLYINGFLLNPPPNRCTTFPALTHLDVRCIASCNWLDKWIMPSLNELHLPYGYSYSDERCPGVLTHAGMSLRVLRLGTSFRVTPNLLSQILCICPKLEEIYYFVHPNDDLCPWESEATHVLLRMVGIDFVGTGFGGYDKVQDYFGSISKTRFPSLHTIMVDDIFFDGSTERVRIIMESKSDNFGSAEIRMVQFL
ncbi:hypothetical protein BD410DRAFT_844393 [Rickenella mellea]|uniref:F-box domain-containing protein n=1 Tax=Rickenella mellea TaxID=50990 RepID=A0A4Y7PPK2_9AGAM|nr:hypothetical protein BD410DRAFT_844393 [Rickenella mellea]